MKIAQVCHRYHPNKGGVENHVREISERLAKKFHVEVISADLSSDKSHNEEINGVKVRRFNSFAPNDAYFFSPQIFFYLRKSDFDIIHAHNYHAFPALFASLVKCGGFIFTPHYHGMGTTWLRSGLNKPYKLLGSKIFRRAERIICVSEFEKELIKRNFGVSEDKMIVIPNGIAVDKIEESKPFDFDGYLILYIGRLEKYKNIHFMIKAMKYLPEDFYFYIGGSGSYEGELRNLIHKLGLERRIRLLGSISDDEKYRWMKSCSLFVNLSGIEAFGMTVLEALAAKKPVIVNEEGGLKGLAEKFHDAVLAIDAESISGERLASLIEKTIGKIIKIDVGEYNWERVVDKIEAVYEEVST
ncbi:MAG: glycosyltransferase family 4 protein [Candidatus Syntropharchaeia archaeon]